MASVLVPDGRVVQQGMNGAKRQARRYQRHSQSAAAPGAAQLDLLATLAAWLCFRPDA